MNESVSKNEEMNMNDLSEFFDKIKMEMAKQTREIISQMDDKLVPFTREIAELKSENQQLKIKITTMEKSKRFNNLIIFGMKENERSPSELLETTKEKIKNDLKISLENRDINTIYRIGKKDNNNGKDRPILVSFVSGWMKIEIMKNKNKLKDAYVTEDFPKEILEKRKQLQTKLVEERKKGNYAVIKYDKLLVREGSYDKENRKRNLSLGSPETLAQEQPRKQYAPSNTNRINAFDVMRSRTNSLSSASGHSK